MSDSSEISKTLSGSSGSFLFTSESVSEGHPDKVADQISDAILDELIHWDPNARVACETLVKTGLVVVAGEITTNEVAKVNARPFADIAREVVQEIGYDDPSTGFDYKSFGVIVAVDRQSQDISLGVDGERPGQRELGAGDQGMMFGYAVNETPELMPASLHYSHEILKTLALARKSKAVDFLRPDAKSQVTVEYAQGVLKRINTIVLSTMHTTDVSLRDLEHFIVDEIIKKSIPSSFIDKSTKFLINPTGRFIVGGPQGDCGLTGRKIIVDSYGGHGAHGGGAFSGKDPTKVDRSAAYLGRYVAKNLVAASLAQRALVQIAYAIGVPEPVSVNVQTFGTEKVPLHLLEKAVLEIFPLKPQSIINHFKLQHPSQAGFKYKHTAAYGHFGRPEFPWERVDKVSDLLTFMAANGYSL